MTADTCRACHGDRTRVHGNAICSAPCEDCGGTGVVPARDPLADLLAERMSKGTSGRYIVDYGIGPDDLAAAVRAYLTSDETVERAAAGIAEWRRHGGMAGDTADEQRARAALTAATEARP